MHLRSPTPMPSSQQNPTPSTLMLHILQTTHHIRNTPQTQTKAQSRRPRMRRIARLKLRVRHRALAARRTIDWRGRSVQGGDGRRVLVYHAGLLLRRHAGLRGVLMLLMGWHTGRGLLLVLHLRCWGVVALAFVGFLGWCWGAGVLGCLGLLAVLWLLLLVVLRVGILAVHWRLACWLGRHGFCALGVLVHGDWIYALIRVCRRCECYSESKTQRWRRKCLCSFAGKVGSNLPPCFSIVAIV